MRKTLLTIMALCLGVSMQAQINYTDLSSNPVVIGTDYAAEPGYPINFMSGDEEFYIQNYGSVEMASYLACFTQGSGVVASGENYDIVPLSLNTVIGPNSSFYENTDGTPVFPILHCNSPEYAPTLTYTTWVGQTAYAGLKFKNGNNTYYGWVKIKVEETPTVPTFTVYGYAYNSTAGATIKAGQTQTSSLEEITENEFSLYPNPTQDFLKITNSENITKVSITNLCGQELLSFAQPKERLNVSSLEKGMYFITLYTKDNSITKKFIKQ